MSLDNSKSSKLRALLLSGETEFAMEAHSGISAVIAEEAGFKCLWASGLSMSAMTGCRDRNELDISEVCKIVEWMADHTTVPILVDGDTGGVDFNAARIMVNKLAKAGAAGVCIEDKLYPKHNSFLSNSKSDLADPHLHAGKIRAMKAENPDFVVIARLEEFISGEGLSEAYSRALIYQEAGADAILVHSKIKTFDEVESFMNKWNKDRDEGENRIPIVIVPTKYYTTPTTKFREAGISLVIWANHNMRSSITAMQKTSHLIHDYNSLVGVEKEIAPVNEIFRLQRDAELSEQEQKFSPAYGGKAVILSAVASSVHPDVPKVLEKVGNRTILDHQIEAYNSVGVDRVIVVAGDHGEKFDPNNGKYHIAVNYAWKDSTEVLSTATGINAESCPTFPFFISYGDLIFKPQVLSRMAQVSDADIVVGVDPEWDSRRYNELITGDRKYSKYSTSDEFNVKWDYDSEVSGSSIGIICINNYRGYEALLQTVFKLSAEDSTKRFIEVWKRLEGTCKVKGVFVLKDEWVDISTKEDIEKAGEIS